MDSLFSRDKLLFTLNNKNTKLKSMFKVTNRNKKGFCTYFWPPSVLVFSKLTLKMHLAAWTSLITLSITNFWKEPGPRHSVLSI